MKKALFHQKCVLEEMNGRRLNRKINTGIFKPVNNRARKSGFNMNLTNQL